MVDRATITHDRAIDPMIFLDARSAELSSPLTCIERHGTALKWFENNKETLTSWDEFQRALGEAFGQQEEVIKEAESLLKNRDQKVKESSEAYIQDIPMSSS
ncbi:hypothetical protein LAZ67_4002478 [Cordylochernes scorpioides]|uniref:Retrotransposon gag domain-containing protein n=1 Tax=Cordylochernes scorpioides TaxID=51811 RepID=A0ABY6KEL2_9ARAC|nr:hypothetical protein LAZ67_4002478 [Cordylochernes scorpioides]